MRVQSCFSHHGVGILWFNLRLGLLLVFAYMQVVHPALLVHTPTWLRIRLAGVQPYHSKPISCSG